MTLTPRIYQKRIDSYLAQELSMYSRSFLQRCIEQDMVTVDGNTVKRNQSVHPNQIVVIRIETPITHQLAAEPVSYEVLFEDDNILVVNKPAGLVCHPGAGNLNNTLLNGLIYDYPQLRHVERCGLIHRLDKFTSGILLVAKNPSAHNYYTQQLKERLIKREYLALVYGRIISGETISAPLARDPKNRLRRKISINGKQAITHFTVLNKNDAASELLVSLETGRTHQIRVHLESRRFHIIGDSVYSHNRRLPQKLPEEIRQALVAFPRPALHAYRLTFDRENISTKTVVEQPPPPDYVSLKQAIKFS